MIPSVQAANQRMNFPIPGQSLTNDPNNLAPFEGPPEFVTIYEASEYLFERITDEENYADFMNLIVEGMPLVNIVQTILFQGFSEGKWDSDLMMLLFEPLTYIFIALCEHINVDPKFDDEDDDDAVEDLDNFLANNLEKNKMKDIEKAIETKVPEGIVSRSIMDKIETLPTSLMAKPEEV